MKTMFREKIKRAAQKVKTLTRFKSQIIALALVLSYQACGPGSLQTPESNSIVADPGENQDQGQNQDQYVPGDNSMEKVQDVQAVGVTYSENMLMVMLNLTGVTNPSTQTINSYSDKKGKVGESGRSETVTAPMWMALTNLAGDVCLDLVNQEKALPAASRRIFEKINFSLGPEAITAKAKDDVIRRMARSFWARNESTVEKALIRANLDDAFVDVADTGTQTENAMIYLCAAMLASLDAQQQ